MTETNRPAGATGTARESLVDSRYPSLKREASGQLKLAWRLAHEDDDWSKGGRISDGFDRWTFWPYMAKFTYDLTYAIRMLAKMAEQTPAWREVYVDAGERLNHRMTQYASWYDWVEQKGLDPNRASYPYFYYRHTMPPGMAGVYNAPGYCGNGLQTYMDGLLQSLMLAPVTPNPVHPYVHQHSPGTGGRVYDPDPVHANGSSNMMYRGYFLEQLAHMRRISGDTKYDDPLELVYDEEISYRYSAEQIAAGLCEQFRAPMDANGSSLRFGIDCEVGKVFPICVTVGGLGLFLFDQLHGTKYFGGYEEWLDFAKEAFIAGDPDDDGYFRSHCVYYDRDINYNLNRPENMIAGFPMTVAMQMSPFDRRYAERLYESVIRYFGRQEPDGSLRIVFPKEIVGPADIHDVWATAVGLSLAHEFGDAERVGQFLSWFEQRYEPTYDDGEFSWSFGVREAWPRGIPNHWAALAFIGEPGDFARLYHEVDMRRFDEPTVVGIDFPAVTVRQAFWDRDRGVLAVAIGRGSDSAVGGSPTTFRVTQLPHTDCDVTLDGQPFTDWSATGPGEITIRATLDDHHFLVGCR
jgi:hypothetical protein